ncbi:MAG: prolipoprotein diacylglyceryl transferase, partial [Gallionellaceae bacterium]|nr:prolipoprotein diacylglyceryl transferase [Gallionellaceae bacterium]
MLAYPQIDPVALRLGPLAVHWYGLMYLLGFGLFFWLGKRRLRMLNRPGWDDRMLDDLLFYGVLGVVLGGRLGEVLFYQPGYY